MRKHVQAEHYTIARWLLLRRGRNWVLESSRWEKGTNRRGVAHCERGLLGRTMQAPQQCSCTPCTCSGAGGGMPSGVLLWGMLSLSWAVTPRIHNMFSQRGHGGLYVHYGCAGHLNLFTGLSNWTKRLVAHPRGRSICFSSGQSGSCAGTQSTVNILWGPAKILPLVAGKNWKSENQVDWT